MALKPRWKLRSFRSQAFLSRGLIFSKINLLTILVLMCNAGDLGILRGNFVLQGSCYVELPCYVELQWPLIYLLLLARRLAVTPSFGRRRGQISIDTSDEF